MIQKTATENTGMSGFFFDLSPSSIAVQPQISPMGGYKSTSRCGHEDFNISANIKISTCITNETVTSGKSVTRLISPIQAYEIALDTLRTFENKWDAYVQEETRLLFIFEEEGYE